MDNFNEKFDKVIETLNNLETQVAKQGEAINSLIESINNNAEATSKVVSLHINMLQQNGIKIDSKTRSESLLDQVEALAKKGLSINNMARALHVSKQTICVKKRQLRALGRLENNNEDTSDE